MILPCFLITCVALCSNGLKFHEELTNDEIHSTFNVPHDKVGSIQYEVTPLLHDEYPDNKGQKFRRAHSTVQFNAFDKSISLDLLENDNTLLGSKTPLFRAYRGRNGTIQYIQRQFPLPNNLRLYHDVEKRAAIVTFTDEYNKTLLFGTVGDYIIKPIPARLQKVNDPTLYFAIKADPQVNSPATPVEAQYYDSSSNYQPTWQQEYSRGPITQQQQSWPGIPNSQRPAVHQTVDAQYSGIMYPKVLVTVDYETFEKHGSNIYELSKYMVAFWNSVDLIFRELRQPQVRLNIAGLIVPQTRDSAPYFNKGFINHGTLDGGAILSEMQKMFAKERHLDRSTYDIAIAITSRNLQIYREGRTKAISGLANRGLACTEYGIALAEDRGNFYGVAVAAHELGHSLNVTHDGYESNDSPIGPCPESDGHIMSPSVQRGKNALRWSQCSRIAISQFLMSSQAQCMREKPDVGTPYPRILPGKIYSRDEQCSKHVGVNYVSVGSETDCETLWCNNPDLPVSHPKSPAEGTPCGKGSICLHKQCVRDPIIAENMPVDSTLHDPTAIPHKPDVVTPYPTNLPKYVPSRDEQCSKFLGNNFISVKARESDCEILYCQERGSTQDFFPGTNLLAVGSSCGPQAPRSHLSQDCKEPCSREEKKRAKSLIRQISWPQNSGDKGPKPAVTATFEGSQKALTLSAAKQFANGGSSPTASSSQLV